MMTQEDLELASSHRLNIHTGMKKFPLGKKT